VLAVVPARSGSKGIPDKNMARVGGLSLIARAAKILTAIPWIDRRVISTDSPRYAEEGCAHGLEAPFLRPASLSGDSAGALETIVHALESCEQLDRCLYELIVLAEPTSPLRQTSDIESTVNTMLRRKADSALTVSRIDSKCHPHKLLTVGDDGVVGFYTTEGAAVTRRQGLQPLYSRNGLCYCFRRDTLIDRRALLTRNSVALVTERPVANIDEPLDLLWAQFLLENSSLNQAEETDVG